MRRVSKERLRLFDEHLWLVRLLYHRWQGDWRAQMAGCEPEDLLQAGRLGLWVATRKFDPKRGLTFQAIATPCVKWAMHDAIEIARYGKAKHGRDLLDHSAMLRLRERPRKVRP
jgi:DNA-directed RNA polymerase specialized sigma subunit